MKLRKLKINKHSPVYCGTLYSYGNEESTHTVISRQVDKAVINVHLELLFNCKKHAIYLTICYQYEWNWSQKINTT